MMNVSSVCERLARTPPGRRAAVDGLNKLLRDLYLALCLFAETANALPLYYCNQCFLPCLRSEQCALGRAQLGRIAEILDLRWTAAQRYDSLLTGIPNLELPHSASTNDQLVCLRRAS